MRRMLSTSANLAFGLMLTLFVMAMLSKPVHAQRHATPSSLLNYSNAKSEVEGDGYMVGGEFWTVVKPMNTNEANHLEDPLGSQGYTHWVQIGPDGTNWAEPPNMWPGDYRTVNSWRDGHRMTFPVFEADGWPGYGPGNVIRANGGDATEDNRFMFAYYSPDLQGANDPERNYKHPAHFTDASRTHMVYEAGFPTTAGLDFDIRAQQFSSNEQNLNDFVTLEITVTNTGVVDTNGDGNPEATDHKIDALGATILTLPTIAVEIGDGGDRGGSKGGNRFGALRTFGYVATPDETNAPYNLTAWYANVPEGGFQAGQVPPEGQRLFGFNDTRQLDGYTDVWNAWSWLGVKQGSYQDGVDGQSPDKQTLFGTNPVGKGQRRGWYTSQHFRPELLSESLNRSDFVFHSATATWYEDYGVTPNADLAPDPDFFSGGTPDDVTTFEVGNSSARPSGDYKYASEFLGPDEAFENPVWEDAWNPQAQSGDFFNGTGFNRAYTFGNRCYSGIGPFGLDVGESITMVLTLSGGYRLEGVADATEASRWSWDKDWDLSGSLATPPAPDISVEGTQQQSARIHWTDVSGIDPGVDGYKIWRAARYKRLRYKDAGMRLLDQYQHQSEVGAADSTALLDPINPYFGVENRFTEAERSDFIYQPADWGTYDLVAKIPAGDLSQYEDAGGNFDYSYEDTESITGFTYWYYVSAYKEGSYEGPQGAVEAGHIESSNLNRNGRNSPDAPPGEIGLASPWNGTYPFADLNSNYPEEGTTAYQNRGVPFTLTPPAAEVDQVAERITVSPNPYKETGLNDDRSDPSSHNIYFLNMPEDFTLTIIDVTGQIIFQDNVEGAPDGQYVWDMFSKDGVEVASGLYIYHIEYGDGRAVTGHLAILR